MEKIRFIIILAFVVLISSLVGFKAIDIKRNSKKNEEIEEKVSIPKVSFWGDMSNLTNKKEKRKIILKYESKEKTFESHVLIKLQGTSSLRYEKKNYTIEFYENDQYEQLNALDVGLGGKQSIYCLKANWIDKTHARNVVTARIMSEIQKKYNLFMDAPNNGLIDGYPVEIYLNGEFLGLYTWNIPKDAWMFNMDVENENHVVFVAENWNRTNLFKEEANFDDWDVEVGNKDEKTLEKLNRLINFINNSDNETFKKEFNNYLNFDATINYLIMMEFAALNDNIAKNMLLVTYDGKIWYPSLYDLDTSWGTKWDGSTTTDYKQVSNIMTSRLWKKVIENYSYEIGERYFELRKSILTKENVMKEFNKFYKTIPEDIWLKENERWENIPGYDYKQIEEFLDTRLPIIDELMKKRMGNQE